MKITICLDDQLFREAKRSALESGRTLTAVIEDALREAVARRKRGSRGKRAKLITDGGHGLQPGVSLDDNSALRDVMDGRTRDSG